MQPGRSCPLHYRYTPASLNRPPEISTDVLYVIGGLYGNQPALRAVESLAAAEPKPATLVFNGDFNWFNSDAAGFKAINEMALTHHALRGNVETELSGDDDAAGCGCGYPDHVSDAEVERSNAMLAQLRATARAFPQLRAQLAALPMNRVAEIGGLRVAIVHGDCESLAGWAYDESALAQAADISTVAAHFTAARARIIASSHTCLPVALKLDTVAGPCALFNNGAAGMPNFAGTTFGVITRIATTPAQTPAALYGTVIDGVHIDALAVHYDTAQWQQLFMANWPAGSAGHLSYHQRITSGPRYGLNRAMRTGIHINTTLLRTLRAGGDLK
jgi:predicted phosphodiesterase